MNPPATLQIQPLGRAYRRPRPRPSYGRRLFFRLALRIAVAFAMRRFWLLETNHRFLRRALRTPALATSLRHLFSRASS